MSMDVSKNGGEVVGLVENNPKSTLGLPGGKEIDNKNSILSEIDKALGLQKPPSIEFIFVEPWVKWSFGGFGLSTNPYGHAAVRYTLPSGEQKLMNIVGFGSEEMVYFVKPEDYFFGTGQFLSGSEQMGVYNRNFVSVRIEEWPDEKIQDMDYYFNKLKRKTKERKAKYSFLIGGLLNVLREYSPFNIAERGNCAWWTSRGLAEADVIDWPKAWPKAIWVEVFEKEGRRNPNNVHVVSYRRIPHAQLSYGKKAWTVSGVAPMHSLDNLAYRNLEKYANVVVEVSPASSVAQVRVQKDHSNPSYFRYHRFSILTASLLSFYAVTKIITKRGGFFKRSSTPK